MTRTVATVALFLLATLLGCGASMRPIPEDAEPVPRTPALSVALARPDRTASAPAAGPRFVPARTNRPQPCADSRGRPLLVRRIAPDEWLVARGVIDVIRGEGKVVMSRRIAASGATIGLAIEDIGKDSCLGVLGFADGDVLRTINGRTVGVDGFLSDDTVASIVKNGSAVVRFDRGGRPRTVVYEVRNE